MAHLIDKDAVVAEIEKLFEKAGNSLGEYRNGAEHTLISIKDFLDTIEMKGVDLDFQRFAKEMDAIFALPSSETKNTEENPLNWEYAIAKHFFELGMTVSNKVQKDK